MSTLFNRSKSVVLLSIVGVIVAASSIVVRSAHESEPLTPPEGQLDPATTSGGSSRPAVLPHTSRGVEVGVQLQYAAEYRLSLEGDVGTENGLKLLGTSVLTLTIESVSAAGVSFVGQISKPTLLSENASVGDQELRADILEHLTQPFRLSVEPSGKLATLHTEQAVRGFSLSVLKLMVSGLQFVSASDNSRTWTAEEADAYGTYRAQYTQVDTQRYTKQKLEYLVFSEGFPTTSKPKISYTASVVHDGNFIQSIQSEERTEIPFGEDAFVGENTLTLELRSVTAGQAPKLAVTLHTANLDEPLRPSISPEEYQRDLRRQRISGKSFHSLREQLSSAREVQQRLAIMDDMAALVEFEPSAIHETLRDLKDPQKTEQRDILLGALASAQSPEAKNALSTLAEDANTSADLRREAATQLGLVEQPTVENVDALRRLSDDEDPSLASAATLALGGAARRANAGSDEAARNTAHAAVDELVADTESATSERERMLLLDALGNAGAPQGLRAIETALNDPSPAVRARAIAALRHIPGPEVDKLLLGVLGNDEDEAMRLLAMGSIAERPMNEQLVAGLFVALQKETAVGSRREAVRGLSAALPREDAMIALAWGLEHEKSEEIRRAIDEALATAGRG